MNLLKAVENCHSRAGVEVIVKWVGHSPSRFGQLTRLLLKGARNVQIRASWPLSYCCERFPELAGPHLKQLVRHLRNPDVHGSVRRSVVRSMQFLDIPKSLQGEVADLCFGYLANPSEEPAIRIFSMSVLLNLVEVVPDLGGELKLIIEDQLPYASPGFRSRAKKVLKQLNTIKRPMDRKP